MAFDILRIFRQRLGENYALHTKYVNPAWARVTQLIGYDKVYVKAEGCHLWDKDGTRYLDCVSGFCVSNIGHNHPVVRQALRDALTESLPNLIQLDCSLLSGLLAEALVQRIPWLEMVFFANSGSEAIEAAIKFTRCATGRQRIVYAHGSYHGVTYGALSVTGHTMWREGFEPLVPQMDAVPFGDADAIEKELLRGNVAGVLLEPIQVSAGIVVPTDEYFACVESLCRKHKALFIMDEIHTGVGRTGKFLACEQWHVQPDIICLSKGLSGAMVPVSAVVTRKDIMKGVFSRLDRSCVHASTFMGNNLAMIAGLATLHVLETENLFARCSEMGDYLLKSLKPFEDKYELVKAVRGRGLLVGVELGEPKSFYLRQAWTMMHKINPGLFAQALTIPLMEAHAILTQVAGHNEDVLKVAPAFVITKEDVDEVARALDCVLKAAHSFPGPFWEVSKRLAANALF
ncbi:MAG: aminotransferase class III-fold pyridoxal phosphate-dependent enzyme [Nitrospirota bacterium]|nr:aminotransferase class III-fold pyridoxal phosphate-dependent enzyme [Nitrospirota bacterium]